MAPHGVFPARGDDEWVSIACRDERDWRAFAEVVGESWVGDARFQDLAARKANEDALEALVSDWTRGRDKFEVQRTLLAAGVPAAAVQKPEERVDRDPDTEGFGLWPTVQHTKMGAVRTDGLPVHLSETDWRIERGAPCLGEHTEEILTELLGLSSAEVAKLREEGVV
jgi:crotonobetainyl-CoA:carnitine CoA-transferase CaiB-like acyl-CoA transferase